MSHEFCWALHPADGSRGSLERRARPARRHRSGGLRGGGVSGVGQRAIKRGQRTITLSSRTGRFVRFTASRSSP
jgi:hypothetical protein